MATFETPGPISVVLDLAAGGVRVTASARTDTVVEVAPADSTDTEDVKAADRARIEFNRSRLVVKVPAPARRWPGQGGQAGQGGAVFVTIDLPEGSQLRVRTAAAAVQCEGTLGDCRFDVVNSDLRLERTGQLRVTAVRGEVGVARVVGHARVSMGSGTVRIDEVNGTATVQNDYGETAIGEITGALRLAGTNGDQFVDRALGDVQARTAYGNLRIGEITRGTVSLTSAFGEIEVGVREGTAVKLDARTMSGQVRNALNSVDGPREADEIVQVSAQTFDGDVVIRRS